MSVATEVLGVDEVAVADAAGELLAELVEQLVALVTGRLDFDGPDLGATREEEIDLVVVVGCLGGPDVVKQLVARGVDLDEIPKLFLRKMYGIPKIYRRIMYGIAGNESLIPQPSLAIPDTGRTASGTSGGQVEKQQ